MRSTSTQEVKSQFGTVSSAGAMIPPGQHQQYTDNGPWHRTVSLNNQCAHPQYGFARTFPFFSASTTSITHPNQPSVLKIRAAQADSPDTFFLPSRLALAVFRQSKGFGRVSSWGAEPSAAQIFAKRSFPLYALCQRTDPGIILGAGLFARKVRTYRHHGSQ